MNTASNPSRSPAPAETPSPGRRPWLIGILVTGLTTLVTSGVVAVLGYVFWTSWASYEAQIKEYIVETVRHELDLGDTSRVLTAIDQGRLRKLEVGAINAGSFTLTATNRSQTVYVYFPIGHTGKVYYKFTGDIIPNERYIALQCPDNRAIPIETSEGIINLQTCFKNASKQAEQIQEVFENDLALKGALKNLRAFTFQLVGSEFSEAAQHEYA